MVENAIANIAN